MNLTHHFHTLTGFLPRQFILQTIEKLQVVTLDLVSDGSQGLKPAVPLTNIRFSKDKNTLYRPIRLLVHHYIDYDDSGVAKICLSRLVTLRGA